MAGGTICLIDPVEIFIDTNRWFEYPHNSGTWWLDVSGYGFRLTLRWRLRRLFGSTGARRLIAHDAEGRVLHEFGGDDAPF